MIVRLFYTPFTPELIFHGPILTSSLVHAPFIFLIFSWGHVLDCFVTLEVFLKQDQCETGSTCYKNCYNSNSHNSKNL